jgi:Mor family transcriptional regulator
MNEKTLRMVASKNRRDILEPFDAIMDLDGFEAICAFSDLLSGRTVYIPKKKTIFMRCLEREAEREFNGSNLSSLSHKYGLSDRHLRRVFGLK